LSVPLIFIAFYIKEFRDAGHKFRKLMVKRTTALVSSCWARLRPVRRRKNHDDDSGDESDSDSDLAAVRTSSLATVPTSSLSRTNSEAAPNGTAPTTGRFWWPFRSRSRFGRAMPDNV